MIRTTTTLSLFLLATLPAQNQGTTFANGTTAYLDAAYSPTLVPTGGVTVEAVVTYDGSTLGSGWRFPTVLRMDPSPNQASYFLRVEAGQTRANRLLWWVSTTNGNFTVGWNFPAATLTTGAHVAATYDGATMNLIVNGVTVATAAATGAILDRGGTFRIGSGDLTVSGGETWNGMIDEVRVWPFARSAAAIAATMQQHLEAVPGAVSTWNLEGNGNDSSGGNHAAANGTVVFGPNPLALQVVTFPGLLGVGAGSGCRTTGLAAGNGIANVGNAAFAFVGTGAPTNAGGFEIVSLASLPVPLSVLGIDVLIDIGAGASRFVQSNALGTATAGFAVPANPVFTGLGFFAQFAWLDPTCANGLSASNAIFAAIQP